MFKNFPWFVVKEFLCSVAFAFILFLIALVVFVASSYAQEPPAPTCSASIQMRECNSGYTPAATLCPQYQGDNYLQDIAKCNSSDFFPDNRVYRCYYGTCSCPEGYSFSESLDVNGNFTSGCSEDQGGGDNGGCPAGEAIDPTSNTCAPSYDDPFECAGGAAGGTAVQNASGGYSCQVGDNYPCPAGTTPGTAFDGNGNSVNTCMADNGNSSSDSNSSSQNSSSGNGNSSGSGDDGSGDGSSSGNETGNSSSASSNGSGGNGSSSSGQGGSASSAGAGQCDPTAKNYLECLNTKELEIPSEKGSYDGAGGTSTEDRIGELEGELQGVVDQIKSEINDTVGVNLSSGGTLTDQCYQIMKVQVCFGWARWSQHLALIANAILAMAYIASFVIIMRQ